MLCAHVGVVRIEQRCVHGCGLMHQGAELSLRWLCFCWIVQVAGLASNPAVQSTWVRVCADVKMYLGLSAVDTA